MEGLAPLLFFALIGLVQLLVRWLRAAQQRQQQQQRPPAPRMPTPAEVAPEDDAALPFPRTDFPPVVRVPGLPPPVLINERVPDDEELMIRRPVRAAQAPPAARQAPRVRARLGSRAEVRRAIVLMEILGPPRAAAANELGSPR